MDKIESVIQGSHKLTDIFGHWPSFHDAEVIELHFCRGDGDPERKRSVFPVLTLKVHLWELTRDMDEDGFLVRRHHTLANLRFHDVDEFSMDGFNHQNAILELVIEQGKRGDGPSPFFAVRIEAAFGISASFNCLRIEILDATPCTKDGEV